MVAHRPAGQELDQVRVNCGALALERSGLKTDLTLRASVESQLPATLMALGFLLTYAIKQDSQFLYFWLMQQGKVYIFSILGMFLDVPTPRLPSMAHEQPFSTSASPLSRQSARLRRTTW